jgi:hypothetical protein
MQLFFRHHFGTLNVSTQDLKDFSLYMTPK